MPFILLAQTILNFGMLLLLLKGLKTLSDTQVTERQIADLLAQDEQDLATLLQNKDAIIAKDDADIATLKANPGDPDAMASLLQTHTLLRGLLNIATEAAAAPASPASTPAVTTEDAPVP